MFSPKEDLCTQATEKATKDRPTTTCPSTASCSLGPVTSPAEDDADNEPCKQNDAGISGTDHKTEVKSTAPPAKTRSKVSKTLLSTPIHTRSGLKRLPAKRPRQVVKIVKKIAEQNEHHVSWAAPPTPIAVPNTLVSGVPDISMPCSQSRDTAQLMSALSLKTSDTDGSAREPSINNFEPNTLQTGYVPLSQAAPALITPYANLSPTLTTSDPHITSTLTAPVGQLTSTLTAPSSQIAHTLSAPFNRSASTAAIPFSQATGLLTVPPAQLADTLDSHMFRTIPVFQSGSTLVSSSISTASLPQTAPIFSTPLSQTAPRTVPFFPSAPTADIAFPQTTSLLTVPPSQLVQLSNAQNFRTVPIFQTAPTLLSSDSATAPTSTALPPQIAPTFSTAFSQTASQTVPCLQSVPALVASSTQTVPTSATSFPQTATTFSTPFSQTAYSINFLPSQPIPYLASTPFAHTGSNSSIPFSNLTNQPIPQHGNQYQIPTLLNRSTVPPTINQHTNEHTSADLSLSSSQVAARQVLSKDLPTFAGNPIEWPIFITNYVQSTERCGFTDEENLIRLQRSLKGQALEAVRGKLMIPATVSLAVETLRMLYGRPETIHHALQKNLKEQPPVRKERLETLIHLALAVQNYNATMQAMGLADYLNDPALLNDLIGKLPSDMRLDWGRYRCNFSRIDISVFDSWLYSLATCASHVTPFAPNIYDESKKVSKERINLHDITENNNEKDTVPNHVISCPKCSQSHRLAQCPDFLSLTNKERWAFVREGNLCLRCFKRHSLRRCYSKKQCGVDNCNMPHNPLLHNTSQWNKTNSQERNNTSSLMFHAKEKRSIFRYVPVSLFGKTQSLDTFALIDEGSSCTLIESELALELGLDGPAEDLCLQWTGHITQIEENSKVVSLQISPREEKANRMALRNVRTIGSLNLPVQTLTKEDIGQCEQLQNVPILPYSAVKARLLIGIDHAKLCVPLEIKESVNDGLIGIRCRIGWGVYGRQWPASSSIQRVMHVCPRGTDDRMDELLQNYFSLESVGIKLNVSPLRSKEDEYAKLIMESTTKYIPKEKVWEAGLLWKYKQICLPDSFLMARRRLFCLEAKMNKDPQLKSFMVDKMRDYEQKGYIRKLRANEISSGGKTWYIPFFTVKNKNKNKTRIVWDAAATVENVSLNSVLLKGPDLLRSVVGVLLRFRERAIALSGDIREMFHQIRIAKGDQCAQQFLWREGDTSKKIDVYVMTVMTFGASCSPSLAKFIKNKNAERYAADFPEAVDAILNNTFVDDWLQSVDSEDKMILMAKIVRNIHNEGGFEMRNWLSNSKNVLNALEHHTVEVKKCFEDPDWKFEKVLGMWWMPCTDELTFSGKFEPEVVDENILPTKRSVLRIIMTIFDPLGLLGHFITYAKVILQEIWRSRVNWDEPIFEQEREKWWTWIKSVPKITNIRIPRCHQYLSSSHNVQLHTFVDASVDAYAAVAYLRIEHENSIKCSLVASKTRVAPLKAISIPKLELMAAVIGLRLANFISNEMSIQAHHKFFWSDSKDVLYWIKSDARKFQQFVAVRVGEILEGSQVKQWRWVPSAQNVADDGTKWSSVPNLSSDTRWFSGPSFLSEEEFEWPTSEFTELADINTERLCHVEIKKPSFPLMTVVPNPNNFSKWEIFRGSQQLVFRYIHGVMLSRIKTELKPFIQQRTIKMVDLFIFKACQEEVYFEEINLLKSNEGIPQKSTLHKCSPYLDELGILRMKGRIDAVLDVPLGVKRPIILPQKHRITYLLIEFYHRKYHHHYNEIVVNEIRQQFWITGLRAAVRAISKDCQLCKNRRAVPSAPQMGDLPIERLSPFTRPFCFTGVDYFGPLEVAIGRRKEKRWGVLFTCMTVRAVHIEIAPSLSTDSFLMVLKQFTSRRGVPRRILSDNATNFRGACRVLVEEIEKISSNELERKHPEIEWTFIPPASPHMGGSWERMVRSVKSVLMDILPKEGLREEILRSALADVENIVNSRPLTYVPLESLEGEALTPNHFLLGTSSGMRERASLNGSGLSLSKSFRISSMIADSFWKRWVREVLPCLARRTKWHGDCTNQLSVNDIVIIVDENTKRNTWTKGIIVDVHYGKDNIVRSAVVKTENGLLTRPVVKLAKLDVKK